MPKNINCISITITLEGTEEIKTEKMPTKQPEECFFHKHCKKTATNIVILLNFDWLLIYIERSFDSRLTLVYFGGI